MPSCLLEAKGQPPAVKFRDAAVGGGEKLVNSSDGEGKEEPGDGADGHPGSSGFQCADCGVRKVTLTQKQHVIM